jgi:DNA-directed RNA polymerase subunit L
MRATVGNGKQNARFIPTSQCSYRYTPDPDPARIKEVFNAWLISLKKVTPASLESNAQRKEELEREFATMEAARCYLEENGEPYSFDFTLETVGVLPPTYSVARALELLQARCLKYASMNVGDLPEGLKIVPADAAMQGFDFLFTGEDHTLGNLLSTYIEQNLMQEDSLVSFIGYKVPHPLRDEMLLRVGVEKDGQQISARAVVSQAAKGCADLFGAWRAAWETYNVVT